MRSALVGEDPNEQLTMSLRPSLIVGHLRLYTGRLSEAIDVLERARATATAFGNENDLVVVSGTLAWAHCWAGHLARARVHADETLAVASRLESVPGRCVAASYGDVPYAFLGDLDRAEALAAEGLELAETTGFGTGRMWASWSLIVAALEADRPARAIPVVEALLGVVDELALATPVRVMALADTVEGGALLVDACGNRVTSLDIADSFAKGVILVGANGNRDVVAHNTILDSPWCGIEVDDFQDPGHSPASDNVVVRNVVRDAGVGIAVGPEAGGVVLRTEIVRNDVRGSRGDAIDLTGPSTGQQTSLLAGNVAASNGGYGIEALRGAHDSGGNRLALGGRC